MRVGIIGGGAAGLTAAWLLHDRHEVVLFEKQDRLGGHAHTVDVDDDGQTVPIEAGFEFFSERMWPTFCRLLAALHVVPREFPVRAAVFRTGQTSRAALFPPRDIEGSLSPSLLTPRHIFNLAQLGVVLASVAPLMRRRDTSITVGQVLDRLPLAPSFREELLFPYLLSSWCVDPEEFREFSAYNVLRYSYLSLTLDASSRWLEVVGGTRSYVEALRRQSPEVDVRLGAEVSRIERTDGVLRVIEQGRTHEIDRLVVATNAAEACELLASVSGCERVRELLGRIAYVRTTIAVHGDRRLMPPDERDWSIINVRHDGVHAHSTVWKPRKSRRPIFRSWVTFDRDLPQQLHHVVTFDHPKVTPGYYQVQRALQERQGENGVLLAGLHMTDVDSHESAVLSGLDAARRIDPDAPRLRELTRHGHDDLKAP